jgi:Uncharacterised nucleotidyltransferase
VSLSPEWQLVFCSARAALTGRDGEGPAPDASGARIDWQRPADLACQNRVGPLVYSTLRHVPLPTEARPALEILKSAYVATAARNAVLFRELKAVLEALAAERIPVIVLKGAALAELVYAERALRPMADIDLLIRKEDLEEAERRLRSVGYEEIHDPRARQELRARHHHWIFRNARPGASEIPIELHWNLDPPRRPAAWDIPALFERAEAASIAGVDALVLSPEDFLLHLCLHLCRHRFNGGVIALCDIAAFISSYGGRLDWTRFERLAAAGGASRYASIPLHLAAELMGADVPTPVLASLRASEADDGILELARERILEEKGDIRGAAQFLLRWWQRNRQDRAEIFKRALARAGPNSSSGARLPGLLKRYVPWIWALARHPGRVSRVVGREARKAKLDTWCAPPEVPPRDRQ